jgi:hypothetical protein
MWFGGASGVCAAYYGSRFGNCLGTDRRDPNSLTRDGEQAAVEMWVAQGAHISPGSPKCEHVWLRDELRCQFRRVDIVRRVRHGADRHDRFWLWYICTIPGRACQPLFHDPRHREFPFRELGPSSVVIHG